MNDNISLSAFLYGAFHKLDSSSHLTISIVDIL